MIDSSKTINFRIGQRIRHLRKNLKYSGKLFAKELGISQQQLSRYERGTNRISIEFVYLITEKFDVHISYFLQSNYMINIEQQRNIQKKNSLLIAEACIKNGTNRP
ncbi:helix-turn-helix domain-containing protein [Proteus sp. G4379]|uniref:helix-turn-helix domain-containing protein n=1 Tax=Proteus sp. G4379 TaxID=2698850 RepID=UPI001376B9C1|nr:helix-turn-helix transcriptional regulator [Proteus sp. G4379]MBI6494566.1 helix-turn-helix transcriptional regulator [Proteus mirabilis]NBN34135.1 helix-turn-helix domain-containing protein [Proteus sp. G4379]